MSANPAWHDPAHPISVEYAPQTLERIRRLAVDGLLSLPRVGLGVGGFFLGTRGLTWMSITGFIPIECGHANGPSFCPTEAEIQAANSTPIPDDVEILGCYFSRPRRPIELTESDRILFGQLCPDPCQLFLFVRPSVSEPSSAVMFYRKFDGTIVGGEECPVDAIELDEPPETTVAAPIRAIEPPPQAEPHPEPEPEPEPEPQFSKVQLFGEPWPIQQPAFAEDERPPIAWRRLGMIAAVLTLMAGTWINRDRLIPRPDLELRTAEIDGHFSLEWNRAAVRGLDQGQLTITDGTASQSIPLDRQQLEAGALPFTRHSPEVTAVLVVGAAKAYARFTAPPEAVVPPVASQTLAAPARSAPPASQPR